MGCRAGPLCQQEDDFLENTREDEIFKENDPHLGETLHQEFADGGRVVHRE